MPTPRFVSVRFFFVASVAGEDFATVLANAAKVWTFLTGLFGGIGSLVETSPKVLYFKIGVAEILRLDLEMGSNQLKYPDMHLVNRNHQNTYVCDPKQLDLLLSDEHGLIKVPLFVKTITRLTPEEAAAIPRQYWP